MPHFFRQVAGTQVQGSLAYLETQQTRFRNSVTSGLIEVETGPLGQVVILMARGTTAGVYRIQEGMCHPIHLADIPTYWTQPELLTRSLTLSDMAARLLWLTLEAQASVSMEIESEEQWQRWLKNSAHDFANTLVEVRSADCDCFAYLQECTLLPSEAVCSSAAGFANGSPFNQSSGPWHISLHPANPAVQAWQCLFLRLGASKWFTNILNRYQAIVGQRLVRFMNAKLQPLVEQWTWEIQVESNTFIDRHFFPQIGLATDAYRSLFMSVGEQVGVVVGSHLTQRLLYETFNRIQPEQRLVLESQRLIPAAFTG